MLVEKYSENHASYQGLIASTQLAGDVGSGNPSGSFVNGFRNAPRYFVKFRAPDTGCISIRMRMVYVAQSGAHLFFGRPQLEKCSEHATQPGTWSNGGVTEIHGGSIIADTITTGKIAAGVIGARELAAGSITAEKVRAGAITADKMAVSKLSAVSSNLGDITGGSLNINNRFKVASDGTLTMRSSTSNVGMVVTNESIIVYDEAGRVRVRIGKLK
jgi:phage tail protein/putative fels-1 prophage host specificity protein